jgi:fibronectin type 3 domain-containing protein
MANVEDTVRNPSRFLLLIAVFALLAGTALFLSRAIQQRKPHRVIFTWYPSVPADGVPIAGYNVYRSTTSGGPYVKIGSRVPDVTYTDSLLRNETTYFYVVTAVDEHNRESQYSNEVRAVIP